jgi:hypothetical protein
MRLDGQSVMPVGQVAHRFGISSDDVSSLEDCPFYLECVHRGRRVYYFTEPVERWLTRSLVARELKRSVATVRAIEDRLLPYRTGPRDVRLFDVEDVRKLQGMPLGVAEHDAWLQNKRREARGSGNRRSRPEPDQELQKKIEQLQIRCELYKQFTQLLPKHVRRDLLRQIRRDPEMTTLLGDLSGLVD